MATSNTNDHDIETTAAPVEEAATTHATTVAVDEHASGEAGLLASLGIEGKLFVAQLINFALILAVLWKFAYKPLLKAMDERSKKIEQGLKDAASAGSAAKLAEEDRLKIVAEARKAAKEIMDNAAVAAEKERADGTARAKAEVAKVVEQGRAQLAADQQKMLDESKAELGSLVALATEMVLKQKMDAKTDAALIDTAIKHVSRA